jgi:hypothetical protein
MSREAAQYFKDKKQYFDDIASGIFRIMSPIRSLVAVGSGIRLFSDIIATNNHVYARMPAMPFATANGDEVVRIEVINDPNKSTIEVSPIYDARSYVLDQSLMVDPLLGLVGDFAYTDFTALKLNMNQNDVTTTNSNVIYVPSARTAPPGTPIVTISYPGSEEAPDYGHLPEAYKDYLLPFETMKKRFGGFKCKVASYGKVIHPYNEDSNKWVEDTNYVPTSQTEAYVLSNECLMGGSSGSGTFRDDFKSEVVQDSNGKNWRLVEINAIHFGGEFVPCSDCVEVLPKDRQDLTPDKICKLNSCQSCKNGTNTKISYNYGVSFHHPALVHFYKRVMKQKFVDLFGYVPKLLQEYYDVHN